LAETNFEKRVFKKKKEKKKGFNPTKDPLKNWGWSPRKNPFK